MMKSLCRKLIVLFLLGQVAVAVGCGDDTGTSSTPGGDEDTGVESDTSVEDTTTGEDTSEEDDTGTEEDTGSDEDTSEEEDAGEDTGPTDATDTDESVDADPDAEETDTTDDDSGIEDASDVDPVDADGGTTDSGSSTDTAANDTSSQTDADSGGTTDVASDTSSTETGTDTDAGPVCGNGIVESGEECDDGNTTTGDGCTAECELPTAFRIHDAELVDPHIYAETGFTCGCNDVTALINTEVQNTIDSYDANFLKVFRPLDLSETTNRMDFYPEADCDDADNDGVAECSPGGSSSTQTTATNIVGGGGDCFTAQSSRLNSNYTDPNEPSDPCFSTDRHDVTVDFIGCSIKLEDTLISANYSSNSSPTELNDGVLTGFLSENEARSCTISNQLLCNSPTTLYEILDDGNNCGQSADKDTNGSTSGWWFYLNFSSDEAEWTQ